MDATKSPTTSIKSNVPVGTDVIADPNTVSRATIPTRDEWVAEPSTDDEQFETVLQAFNQAKTPGQEIRVKLNGPPSEQLLTELTEKGYSYRSEYRMTHRSGQKPVQSSILVIGGDEKPFLRTQALPDVFRDLLEGFPFGTRNRVPLIGW